MKKHYLTLCSLALTGLGVTTSQATLALYDASIDGSGFTARTTAESAALDGSNSISFDFGAISGDATFEFILRGDEAAGGRDGFLAVGTSDSTNSLRYEQWDNTGQLGFTKAGAADYLFTPAVTSPATDTLVTYRWTDATDTMDLFLDGTLAGTTTGVAATFQMPTGPGAIGNNAALSEGMVGTISRVTTFNSALLDSEIASHGGAWTAVPEPSIPAFMSLVGLAMILRRRR